MTQEPESNSQEIPIVSALGMTKQNWQALQFNNSQEIPIVSALGGYHALSTRRKQLCWRTELPVSFTIHQRFGEERIRVTIAVTTATGLVWPFSVSPENFFQFIESLGLDFDEACFALEDREEPLTSRELFVESLFAQHESETRRKPVQNMPDNGA